MAFITPMFAAPMPDKRVDLKTGEWLAEEKIDGHRLVVEVTSNGPVAWSRNGLTRALPPHLVNALSELPQGIYDGELHVPGQRSYGVTEITNGPDLCYTIFDILRFGPADLTGFAPYSQRREILDSLVWKRTSSPIRQGWSIPIYDETQLAEILADVWKHDGEGLILKNKNSIYVPGKRPKNTWIKLKQVQQKQMTIVGFVPSRGEKVFRGNYAMTVLRDQEGKHTVVKTLNDAECRLLEKLALPGDLHWDEVRLPENKKVKFHNGTNVLKFTLGNDNYYPHVAVGRKIWIEYQERTPEGSYRHPRWDRWVEVGEDE
jgi:ATP-dependent DNA ligase